MCGGSDGQTTTATVDTYRVEADRREAERSQREETEKQQHEAAITAELARPWSERATECETELNWTNEEKQQERLCYAAWLVSTAPEGDKQAKALERHRKKVEREVLAALRREAMASRSIVCADGEYSPTCMCNGNHRGCCSHHGGIAGCERIEEPKITCPALDERGYVALRLFGGTKAP
jgi:hypothetical protein